jgi:hypothetical protein
MPWISTQNWISPLAGSGPGLKPHGLGLYHPALRMDIIVALIARGTPDDVPSAGFRSLKQGMSLTPKTQAKLAP